MSRYSTSQICLVLLALICCVVIVTSRPSKRSSDSRLMGTECLSDADVSLVCYECAKRYTELEAYQTLFYGCCDGDAEIREYCHSIFTVNPQEGGMWSR